MGPVQARHRLQLVVASSAAAMRLVEQEARLLLVRASLVAQAVRLLLVALAAVRAVVAPQAQLAQAAQAARNL